MLEIFDGSISDLQIYFKMILIHVHDGEGHCDITQIINHIAMHRVIIRDEWWMTY